MIHAAVMPPLSLADCLTHWPQMQRDLAERSRKRMPRIHALLS